MWEWKGTEDIFSITRSKNVSFVLSETGWSSSILLWLILVRMLVVAITTAYSMICKIPFHLCDKRCQLHDNRPAIIKWTVGWNMTQLAGVTGPDPLWLRGLSVQLSLLLAHSETRCRPHSTAPVCTRKHSSCLCDASSSPHLTTDWVNRMPRSAETPLSV